MSKHVIAYYPYWIFGPNTQAVGQMDPASASYEGLTHIVHFHSGNVTGTVEPYWTILTSTAAYTDYMYNGVSNPRSGSASWTQNAFTLIQHAHSHGVKVLVDVGAVNAAQLNIVASSATACVKFADAVVTFAEQNGYDGVEINWEGWSTPIAGVTATSQLFNAFKDRMKGTTSSTANILMMAPAGSDAIKYDPTVVNDCFDIVSLQEYFFTTSWNPNVLSNANWHISALHYRNDFPSGFEAGTIDTWGPKHWIEKGYNRSILGIGLPTYGKKRRNSVSAQVLYSGYVASGDSEITRSDIWDKYFFNGGVSSWDNQARNPSITGTAINTLGPLFYGSDGISAGDRFFVTYDDERSLRDKIGYVYACDYGGVMLYDVAGDTVTGSLSTTMTALMSMHRSTASSVAYFESLSSSIPQFKDSSSGSITALSGSLFDAYPAFGGVQNTDLFFLHVLVKNSTTTPTVPSGFNLLFSDSATTAMTSFLYTKLANGSESGIFPIGFANDTSVLKMAKTYRFRNVSRINFTDNNASLTGSTSTLTSISRSLTSSSPRLVCAFLFSASATPNNGYYDKSMKGFIGNEYNDWYLPAYSLTSTSGSRGTIQLQLQILDAGLTSGGGTITTSSDRPWGIRVLDLLSTNDPGYPFLYSWRLGRNSGLEVLLTRN